MKVKSTTYAIEDSPIVVEKEMSTKNAIREFIQCQSIHIFGGPQADNILDLIVNGFFLFNLRKNKYMLTSKEELLKYCKDNSVPLEEKAYFYHIFLYNQRPKFLTVEEHECIREVGNLDGISPPPPPPPPPPSDNKPFGFIKQTRISDHLAFFLGKSAGTQMARYDVSKEINRYILINGLQDMYNGRKINPDENLRNLLNIGLEVELTYFNLQKYMKHHFIK